MTNDFDTVRAYLDSWGEHPRRSEALAALERIEAALRFYADPISYALTQTIEPCSAVCGDNGRRAAARFAETADSPANADIKGDGWGVP